MTDKFNKYKNMYKLNQDPFDQTQQIQTSAPIGNSVVIPQTQVIQPKAYNPFNTATIVVPQLGSTQTFVPVASPTQQVTQVFRAAPKQIISTMAPTRAYPRPAAPIAQPRRVAPQPVIAQPRVQFIPVPQTQQIVVPSQTSAPAIENTYDPIRERYKKEIRSLTAELEILKIRTEQKQKAKTKFEIKISKLDKLLRLRYITKAEYERKKRELIKQAINSI